MNCRRLAILFCLATLGAGFGVRRAGAQSDEAERAPAIRIRRVHVPAARREDWPLGQQKYLPVAPDEFERLLAASAVPAHSADSPALASRLVRAEYEARLDGDRLTEGRGTLWVEHASETRALLRLNPCGLAVHSAAWPGEEPRAAAFGLGVDGSVEMLVEQSGPLEIEWSLSGRRDAAGTLLFPVRLPASPVSRLLVRTHDDVELHVDRGAVLDAGRDEDGSRRWQIELGNRNEFELRAAASGAEAPRPGLALVREHTGYDVSLRGVEVSTEWTLEIHHEPLSQISFRLDEQLQLVTATLGEEPVPWTVSPGGEGEPSRVVLRLPSPVQGTGLLLRLGALAPCVASRPWRLPRIQPEDILWQEGSATLSVRSPLVVERFTTVGCRQTGAEVLAAPRHGESFQLQFFHPEGTAELDIVEREDRVEVVSGTSIQWGEEEVRARVRADFRLAAGTRFDLQAALGPRWMIDAMESTPADAVDQWAVEPDGRDGPRLVVRLARSLAPGRPIRLSVVARRLGASVGESFAMRELAPLDFESGVAGRMLIGLRTPEAYDLEYGGAAVAAALPRESLPPTEAELLDEDDSMAVFRLDGARTPSVRWTPRRPRFQARAEVELRVAEAVVQEAYRIQCEPEPARLDRVVVWLSRQRDVPLEWTVAGEPGVRVSARRWTSDEQLAAGLSPEGEVWEMRLSPPAGKPIELAARRESPVEGPVHPSLASVPDAEVQTGLLTIHAMPGAALRIENQRLRQVPPEPLPADRYATVRAVYRYDPWREVGRVGEPAVVVTSRAAERAAVTSVWEARLDSRFETDGTAGHVAVFHVENLGQDALRVYLPDAMPGGGPVEVWVDQQRVTAAGGRDGAPAARRPEARSPEEAHDGNALRVPLPAGRRYVTITLVFTSQQGRLLPIGSLRAPWPEPEVPVLNRSWTVWLPPGYSSYGGRDAFVPVAPPTGTWSRRLLGPLGREAGQTAFDPLAASHWLGLRGDAADRRDAVERVEAWLEHAAALQSGPANGNEPAAPRRLRTWITHEAASGLRRRVLVDREALTRQGVSPDSAIPGKGFASPGSPAGDFLTRSGLALLVCRDAILLTTQADAARLRPHLEPTSNVCVWWVSSRPLAQRIAYAARAEADRVFVPAAVWLSEPGPARSPWKGDGLSGQDTGDQFGWQAVSPPDHDGAAVVRYYHGYSIELAGAIAFLLAVSAGWWLARHRPPALIAAAGAAGLAGLWIPEPFVPAASGMVLGALFCLAFRLVHRHLSPHPRRRRSATPALPSTISATVPWGLALLVAATAAGWGASAAGDGATSGTVPATYRVFIPVDDEREPVGGMYFLPEPLFAELHRRAAARRDLPQGWLLGEAAYRGELVREPVGDRFFLDEIRARFNLHVFTPSARVEIPLDRSSANLLPDGVRLDGTVVQVEWSADNRALVLEVAEPGHYQVELRMRPRMHAAPPTGFDLSIPPLPMAQLELALPSAAPQIEVPSARGATRREEDPARLIAELGPTDVLSVRWPSGGAASAAGPAIDIEELLWMKVQPGSVLVEAKWNLTILEGQVRRLRLAADPRMRLLPLEGDRTPTVRTLSGDGELVQLVLEWPEPLQSSAVVSARFLLTGTSGVGNLRMPQLDVLDGRMTRRWMAVSVAEALQFERSGAERLSPIPPPEFVAAWGTATSPPAFAYRLPPGTPDWTLATRPREPRTSAEQELTLRFAEHATEVELRARLETTSGYGFNYRIAAPTAFEVARVALIADNVDRAVRWSQDNEGTIHLFLSSPVSGPQQLILHGRLPGALGEAAPVPAFRVEGVQDAGTTLHVLRRPGILVEVRGVAASGTPATGAADAANAAWLSVGTYRLAPGAEQAAAIVPTANAPQLAGSEILRLSVAEGGWHARWECRLDVRDGLLEELSLDAPANWGNRFRTSDGVQWSRRPTEAGRQELSIRPKQPVKDRWWAWISGRLPFAPGEPIVLPNIAMRGPHPAARFVILPRRIDGRTMEWQVQGLQRVPLDEVAPELAPEQGVLAAFRVVGASFSAELAELPAPWDAGRVVLAEYAMAWQEGGTLAGMAQFDIEPGTDPVCSLHFPEPSRPILVKVDGIQSPWVDAPEAGVVSVPLGPPGVPQRVQVVFVLDSPQPAAGTLELTAPRIVDLPVEQTLWTFASPPRRIAGTPFAVDETSAAELALARLEHLSALIDRHAAAIGEDSADASRWYRTWLRHWAAARQAARSEAGRMAEETERRVALERIDSLTEQQREMAVRLEAGGALDEHLASGDGPDGPAGAEHAALLRGGTPAYYKGGGSLPDIAVNIAPLPGTPVLERVLATAGWLALLGLATWGLRRGLLVEWFRRWPHALGVAVGLVWWLWLSPSALGLLLVVGCAAAALRTGWRTASRPASDASAISVRSSHLHGRV